MTGFLLNILILRILRTVPSLRVCFVAVQQASVPDSVGICLIFSWHDKANKNNRISNISHSLWPNMQERPNLWERKWRDNRRRVWWNSPHTKAKEWLKSAEAWLTDQVEQVWDSTGMSLPWHWMCFSSGSTKEFQHLHLSQPNSNMIILTKHTPPAPFQMNLDKRYSNENKCVSCEKQHDQLAKH